MDLSKRSITSAYWNYIANFLIFIITFARQIVLARILPIEVFGIYSFVGSIVLFSIVFPAFGLGPAFLNRSPETEDTDEAAAVFFTLRALFITIWAVVMITGGYFLLDDKYVMVLVVLVLMIGLDSVSSQPARLILIKQVTIRRMSFLRLLSAALTAIFSTILALRGVGIWALLSSDILTTMIMISGLYFWKPVWKPRFLWVNGTVKYFLDMGRKNLLAGLLSKALDRVDDIWTGFFLGEVQMAFYSKAYSYAKIPNRFLSDPLINVIQGSYAELKGDRKRLSRSFILFNSLLLRTGFFAGGVLFLIAPEFITILLGERWLPMLRPFQLMIVFTLLDPIKYSIGNVFISAGRPGVVVKARTIQLGVMIAAIFILGNLYGIIGVAAAVDIMVILGLSHQLILVREFVDYSIKDLFLTPILSISAGIGLYILISNWINTSSDILSAVQKIGFFSLGYLVIFLSLEYKIIKDEYLPLVRKAFRK